MKKVLFILFVFTLFSNFVGCSSINNNKTDIKTQNEISEEVNTDKGKANEPIEERLLKLYNKKEKSSDDVSEILALLPYVDSREFYEISKDYDIGFDSVIGWICDLDIKKDDDYINVLKLCNNVDASPAEIYSVVVGDLCLKDTKKFIKMLSEVSENTESISGLVAYDVAYNEKIAVVYKNIDNLLKSSDLDEDEKKTAKLFIESYKKSVIMNEYEDMDIFGIRPRIVKVDNYLCDGVDFKGGCSWYCAGQIESVRASSRLKDSGEFTYDANNAHDFDLSTVWAEGVDGVDGLDENERGEYLEYRIKGNQTGLAITRVELINGYIKSDKLWKENGRVKKLRVYKNDEPYALLLVEDSKEVQVFDIGVVPLDTGRDVRLKFEILDIYRGSKYTDTVITELEFDGTGDH